MSQGTYYLGTTCPRTRFSAFTSTIGCRKSSTGDGFMYVHQKGQKWHYLKNYCSTQASPQFVTISVGTQKQLINWLSGGRIHHLKYTELCNLLYWTCSNLGDFRRKIKKKLRLPIFRSCCSAQMSKKNLKLQYVHI